MRKAHKIADDNEDRGTAQLLELFIDETEKRTWLLFEASRQEGANAAQSRRVLRRGGHTRLARS
jgi:starvation-inducible DNA-binding protein